MGLSLGEVNWMKFDKDSGDDGSMNENSDDYENVNENSGDDAEVEHFSASSVTDLD